jgi:putative spermidine/putrescine transport system permease protein
VSERRRPPARTYLVLGFPLAMLGIFFLGPLLTMVAASFYRRIPGGFYEPGFELSSYGRLFTELFLDRAVFSVAICLLAGAVCVAVAFPFTYFLTRMPPRPQIVLLVLVLSALSLSEVIVGFSWSVVLGRAAGISNILVWLGLMGDAQSYQPGFLAVLLGLSYIAFPFCVLTLYPQLSRLDREVTEAAQTLGAGPGRTFRTVVIPIMRPTIVAAFLLVFVFTLGSYLIPAILGRPEHWTVSVFISDQASFNANVPFASAMAMVLTVLSLVLVGVVLLVESKTRRAA